MTQDEEFDYLREVLAAEKMRIQAEYSGMAITDAAKIIRIRLRDKLDQLIQAGIVEPRWMVWTQFDPDTRTVHVAYMPEPKKIEIQL